jgi:putative DNA primase/helicase
MLMQPIKAAELFRDEARPHLLYFQDKWLAWKQSHYDAVENKLIRGEIWKFLDANGVMPQPLVVNAVLEGLQAICIRAKDEFKPPCWLSGNEGKPDPNYIIACPNGLLYLRTGKLLKHTPDFFTRNAIDFPYNRNALKPKKWLKRCNLIWAGDHNQILLLQELAGYGLTPDRRYERIFMFVGVTRGGKTVTIKTLVKLWCALNITSPTLESLGTEFGFEALLGKTILTVSDMRLGPHADRHALLASLLKLSGRDSVSVNRKHLNDRIEGVLSVLITIIGNVLPALPDESGALKERMEFIAFRKSFAKEPDRHIEDSFDDELPGILNWAIDGWKRLQAQGDFTKSYTSAQFRENMESLSTRAKPLIDECCNLGEGLSELKSNLWTEFLDFAKANGITAHGNAQAFLADMRTASGHNLKGSPSSPFIFGIELKSHRQKQDEKVDKAPQETHAELLAEMIEDSKRSISLDEDKIVEERAAIAKFEKRRAEELRADAAAKLWAAEHGTVVSDSEERVAKTGEENG